MFTTIKVNAYYTVKFYKNSQEENFKWGHARSVLLSWIRLFFVNIRESESEHAVFDSVQLDASTTKSCKSIRLSIILPIVRLNVYVQR